MNLNLIKGDKIGPEVDYRDALPVNMTAVLRPMFGDSQGYMLQYPGLTQYGTGTGIDRGGVWNERQKKLFRLSGQTLITVDADGTVTELGTIEGTDAGSFPYSFNTQCVIANRQMWLYDPSNGLRRVTDPEVGRPIDCVWVDGYYFLTDGEYLYHTDLQDESAIDPLKFATAEFMPDPDLALAKTADNKVMVFGRYSIEYFINAATDNFAFTRVPTRALKMGIVSTHGQVELGERRYVLGGAKEAGVSIHAVTVGSSQSVATREIDKLIGQYSESDLSDVVMEAYSEDGYSYVVVHLPRETLLLNENLLLQAGADQAWSRLKSDVRGTNPWRGKHIVFDPRKGHHVVGDKRDGKLGFIDLTVATHYCDLAEWELNTPFVYLEALSIDKLEIETIPGAAPTVCEEPVSPVWEGSLIPGMSGDAAAWGYVGPDSLLFVPAGSLEPLMYEGVKIIQLSTYGFDNNNAALVFDSYVQLPGVTSLKVTIGGVSDTLTWQIVYIGSYYSAASPLAAIFKTTGPHIVTIEDVT